MHKLIHWFKECENGGLLLSVFYVKEVGPQAMGRLLNVYIRSCKELRPTGKAEGVVPHMDLNTLTVCAAHFSQENLIDRLIAWCDIA